MVRFFQPKILQTICRYILQRFHVIDAKKGTKIEINLWKNKKIYGGSGGGGCIIIHKTQPQKKTRHLITHTRAISILLLFIAFKQTYNAIQQMRMMCVSATNIVEVIKYICQHSIEFWCHLFEYKIALNLINKTFFFLLSSHLLFSVCFSACLELQMKWWRQRRRRRCCIYFEPTNRRTICAREEKKFTFPI